MNLSRKARLLSGNVFSFLLTSESLEMTQGNIFFTFMVTEGVLNVPFSSNDTFYKWFKRTKTTPKSSSLF